MKVESNLYYFNDKNEKIVIERKYYERLEISIRGNIRYISGDVSSIRGDVSSISGDVSYISGDVSYISGDVSSIRGDVSYISGNVDECELTEEDRENEINIEDLIICEKIGI